MSTNPFDALGLAARPDLNDEQVRAAWRAIAAATHPDRPDGGDASRYTAAAAAYALLRTPWGRSEAFADLASAADDTSPLPVVTVTIPGLTAEEPSEAAKAPVRPGQFLAAAAQLPARVRCGRPLRLVIRGAVAAVLCLTVLALIPGQPAAPALVAALITWFVITSRSDLAARR